MEAKDVVRVGLVVRDYDEVNGLARYDGMLYSQLRSLRGVLPSLVPIDGHPLPGALTSLGQKAGLDFNAFLRMYPLSWPKGVDSVDLIHLTHRTHATLLLRRCDRPTVVTVHDVIHYQHRSNPALHIYRHEVQRQFDLLSIRALRRADCIIASSQYTRGVLIDELELPPDRVHSVLLGVDRNRFFPCVVPDWFFEKHGLDRTVVYILHVGTDEARKNLPTLVNAFERVHRLHPEAQLLRVGRPLYAEQRRKLEEQVNALGLRNAVHMIDEASDDELMYFYNLAKLFVFPSLAEGFGLPVLEAMACGTPVICSNVTSLPEVAGGAALLVDPNDTEGLAEAIACLIEDDESRSHYGQAGLERATRCSWQHTSAETAKVYNTVLEACGDWRT